MLAAAIAAVSFAWIAKSAIAENLLANSSFKLTTNLTTPDYWDLHHAAALRFRELFTQYNLEDTPQGPVSGDRVLKITNSDNGFPFLYLLSKKPDSKLPAGNYVFSVYVKADRAGIPMELAPTLDRMDQRISKTVTTGWQRYSAEFRIDDPDKLQLSPLIVFPAQGTYWVSAPQLEFGGLMSPYAPAPADVSLGMRTAAQRKAAADAITAIATATTFAPAAGLSAMFEFSVYTDETKARLKISDAEDSAWAGPLVCSRIDSSGGEKPLFSQPITVNRGQASVIDIAISGLSPGDYSCSVSRALQSASAKLKILAPHSSMVRINQFRNTLEVNRSGYQIRGVMVGDYVPPDWYFSDIVRHGINTLFFYPREDGKGGWHAEDLDTVLGLAEIHGMKVIVGPSVMGQKNDAWQPQLDRYAALIGKYRNSPAIVGWFVVDEPQSWTLRKNDLAGIYDRIKAIDPYRLVFVNWGSDDVPAAVGDEPHGSLAATDLYSIDYYPFANDKTSLEIYTLRTIRALRTAARAGRPGHSWLQLYGYLDVIREPTGDELNYMAYVNLLYGGNYSFWQTKSNAQSTWDSMGRTNEEMSKLTALLTLNPSAHELKAPTLAGHFLYSAWKAEAGSYLIVLHVADRPEAFTIDLKPLFGSSVSQVRTYFDDAPVDFPGSKLKDSFNGYATKVYKIN